MPLDPASNYERVTLTDSAKANNISNIAKKLEKDLNTKTQGMKPPITATVQTDNNRITVIFSGGIFGDKTLRWTPSTKQIEKSGSLAKIGMQRLKTSVEAFKSLKNSANSLESVKFNLTESKGIESFTAKYLGNTEVFGTINKTNKYAIKLLHVSGANPYLKESSLHDAFRTQASKSKPTVPPNPKNPPKLKSKAKAKPPVPPRPQSKLQPPGAHKSTAPLKSKLPPLPPRRKLQPPGSLKPKRQHPTKHVTKEKPGKAQSKPPGSLRPQRPPRPLRAKQTPKSTISQSPKSTVTPKPPKSAPSITSTSSKAKSKLPPLPPRPQSKAKPPISQSPKLTASVPSESPAPKYRMDFSDEVGEILFTPVYGKQTVSEPDKAEMSESGVKAYIPTVLEKATIKFIKENPHIKRQIDDSIKTTKDYPVTQNIKNIRETIKNILKDSKKEIALIKKHLEAAVINNLNTYSKDSIPKEQLPTDNKGNELLACLKNGKLSIKKESLTLKNIKDILNRAPAGTKHELSPHLERLHYAKLILDQNKDANLGKVIKTVISESNELPNSLAVLKKNQIRNALNASEIYDSIKARVGTLKEGLEKGTKSKSDAKKELKIFEDFIKEEHLKLPPALDRTGLHMYDAPKETITALIDLRYALFS